MSYFKIHGRPQTVVCWMSTYQIFSFNVAQTRLKSVKPFTTRLARILQSWPRQGSYHPKPHFFLRDEITTAESFFGLDIDWSFLLISATMFSLAFTVAIKELKYCRQAYSSVWLPRINFDIFSKSTLFFLCRE